MAAIQGESKFLENFKLGDRICSVNSTVKSQESDEAARYMTFYPITEWPHVSIVDPRTGENMVTWSR